MSELSALTQLGVHVADDETVAAITLSSGGAGLLLGRVADTPLLVTMFGPEALDVVLVGGVRLAQLVAFRAVAIGAQVDIQTSRPHSWERFVNTAAGASGAVRSVEAPAAIRAGAPEAPRLLVVDSDSSVSAGVRRGAPWSTVLTVYDQATQWNVGSLSSADLLLLQPLSIPEARLVGTVLNLRDSRASLSTMDSDQVVVSSRGELQTATVALTSVEQWLIGGVARA